MDAETIGYILLFVCLLLLDAMFCGFIALVDSVRSTDIEKNEEELGEKLTQKLRKIERNEIAYENRALIAIIVITTIMGGIFLPVISCMCFDYIVKLKAANALPAFLDNIVSQYLATALFIVVLLVFFVLF